jgi:membrane protease YdiL (CAAX protease family)
MKERTKTLLENPWTYFAAAFAWTWLFWGIAIALKVSMEGAGIVYLLLGVIGPMVTGIAFVYLTRDREYRREYWKRIISFRRIPGRWYLVIFLFVPILNCLAALIDYAIGGNGAAWGEAAVNALTNPLSIIPSIMFSSLIPLIEEMGWRGYVLDRLQERRSALASSLILGVVWALWHLPLFFVPGTYQAGLGVGTPAFWLFFIPIVPLTLIFSWIFNNTNRSTLAVILFHAMVNFTGELIAVTVRADGFAMGLWFVAAVVITLIFGAKTLTGRD